VPGLDLNSVIEYAHRVLAGAVGIMMIALAVMAVRQRRLVVPAVAAVGLVVAQGLLGAVTVERNLDELLVAAHLGLAMVLLALVLYIHRETRAAGTVRAEPRLRTLAIVASGLVLCTVVAGGYMAGTQKYGRTDYQLGGGAHHACGKEFPTCNGGFMPFGDARLVDIHLTHRFFVYLAVIAVGVLAVMLLRRGMKRQAQILGGLLLLQVVVGALNVWLDEYELLILAHLALGTLLWAASANTVFELAPVRRPVTARAVTA
jgi:heme A synthase